MGEQWSAGPDGGRARVLRAEGRAAVPWKNGGGVTREVAAWPEDAGTGDFGWRVSLAEVGSDGPYSVFPGVDRTLTVVAGDGLELTVAGARRLVDERYVPLDLPGDAPTECRLLGGPVVNFNVMYRRGAVRAGTAVVRGSLALAAAADEVLLVVALEGAAEVAPAGAGGGSGGGAGGRSVLLGRHDALLLTGPAAGTLSSPGRTAVVRFGPAAPARPR
ncbi:HutD family protein [Streptomyces sp. NPDC089919]|uniref:HutD/Ves family protein n=1 Tax=Streptomyces sp. NPDC089919 TaxID=3155188 RepID=UPI00342B0AF5